jgi:hypothetical protein
MSAAGDLRRFWCHLQEWTLSEERLSMMINFVRAAGVAFLALCAPGVDSGSEERRARINERVSALQPTADERRIDRIGWARDIRAALRLARENGRPVFLFTMDGRFSIGRC